MQAQMEREFAEIQIPVPWGHVAAKVYGPPTGMRVLMVHGTQDNAGTFDRLLSLLPTEHRYVSIDLPGHGFSSPFPAGVPIQYFDYVHTVKLVLDTLNWQTCVYIGHSLGAGIGTYFNALYPKRIERLVAIDVLATLPEEDSDLPSYIGDTYALDSYAKDTNKLYTKEEVLYALQFKRNAVLNPEAADALFKRAVTRVGNLYKLNRDPRLRISQKPAFNISQINVFVGKLRMPVLFLVFDDVYKDRNFYYAEVCIKASKNDKFRIINEAGNHDHHNNCPERIAPHICEFLSSNVTSKL